MKMKGSVILNFLKNLEELMRNKNINKSELARACGLSTSTVNSWWNRSCENVSLQTLLKLSKYLNISLEELVNNKPTKIYAYNNREYTDEELQTIDKFATFVKSQRKG